MIKKFKYRGDEYEVEHPLDHLPRIYRNGEMWRDMDWCKCGRPTCPGWVWVEHDVYTDVEILRGLGMIESEALTPA